jgi:mannose-6-phosphate isomerase-like protein (cupin superfamily)
LRVFVYLSLYTVTQPGLQVPRKQADNGRERAMKTSLQTTPPYVTRDGSEIRELMHPHVHGGEHGAANQSLAEATVLPGQRTVSHKHHLSEELYHITAGRGLMILGSQRFAVAAGDTVCIPPGTPHCIHNDGDTPLTILCACSPPYSHEDTELLE